MGIPGVRQLGTLLVVATLTGVVAAGLLLPVTGGVGLAARRAAVEFERLPDVLTVPRLAQPSRLLASDGSTLAVFYEEDRVDVRLAQVPQVMRDAIISVEDARFYQHHGLDLHGILRAAITNGRAGGVQQGGSTLTQQYVKNALLESATTAAQRRAATVDTLSRKIREARYALALERRWSKDTILEHYLNIAYFGDGAYGVGAAARHDFGVPVDQLSLPQAALLAGLVRNPSAYDPVRHPAAALARRGVVLSRMQELGRITAAQATAARGAPLGVRVTRVRNGCMGTTAPFFCEYVVARILADPAFGATPAQRRLRLLRGGLRIHSSLDPAVQRAAQAAVDARVPPASPIGAAIDIVEPGTGLIRAMAVNRSYDPKPGPGRTALNLATGGVSGFQAGSTFKIFVLTAALEKGIPLDMTLNCPARYESRGFPRDRPFPYVVNNAGDSEAGVFTVTRATWDSVNTCYVQLEERTGVDRPAQLAEALGVHRMPGARPLVRVPSFTLGSNEVSPLAMAGAYAAYAAHGRYCPPVAVRAVTDGTGRPVPLGAAGCRQVVDPQVADTVSAVLAGVVTSGTGTGAAIGRPAAGKTGTVEDYSSAWFAGYTPQLSAAVWMGDPRGGYAHPLRGVTIGGQYYPQVYGGTLPAPIWADAMRTALAGRPALEFPPADPVLVHGRTVTVPDVSGRSAVDALAQLSAAGLTATVSPTQGTGAPAGTVVSTDPPPGTTVAVGSSVTIVLSAGFLPPSVAPVTPPVPPPTTRKPAH